MRPRIAMLILVVWVSDIDKISIIDNTFITDIIRLHGST